MTDERTIGRYKLVERLGGGGWGELHRARDTERGRTVALKLSAPGGLQAAARDAMLDAARAAATLSHPNIATLYESGEAGGRCYAAYEYAAGATLESEIEGRPIHPRRAFEIAGQIADALADAHAHGIVHADLRPGTVIVTAKGGVKVLDFGMSRWTRGGETRARAAAHPEEVGADAMRVVSYMSPEQALGESIDGRTDVFSLGAMLHEMLTGRNPFVARTVGETILKIVGSAIPAPSSVNPKIPPDVDALVLRALSKDIEQRPAAAAFAAELRSAGAALDLRSSESRAAAEPTFGDEEERSSVLWWGVVLAGLILGGALVWGIYR